MKKNESQKQWGRIRIHLAEARYALRLAAKKAAVAEEFDSASGHVNTTRSHYIGLALAAVESEYNAVKAKS